MVVNEFTYQIKDNYQHVILDNQVISHENRANYLKMNLDFWSESLFSVTSFLSSESPRSPYSYPHKLVTYIFGKILHIFLLWQLDYHCYPWILSNRENSYKTKIFTKLLYSSRLPFPKEFGKRIEGFSGSWPILPI